MKTEFSRLSPITLFVYFISVIAALIMNFSPIGVFVLFIAEIIYFGMIFSAREGIEELLFGMGMGILFGMISPIFSQSGQSIVFYLFGKEFTFEDMIYGYTNGVMLYSVILLGMIISSEFGSEKFLYLFGRKFPQLSLIITLSVRFLPDFISKFKTSLNVEKKEYKNKIEYAKGLTDKFISVLTLTLENTFICAKNIKARFFENEKKTRFFVYSKTRKDFLFLGAIIFIDLLTVFSNVYFGTFEFFPVTKFNEIHNEVYKCVFSAMLLLLPTFYQIKERGRWLILK